MNSSLQKIKAWRSRRQQRSLEQWEQIRAQGEARFVLRTALTYGLTVVGLTDVITRLSDDGTSSISVVRLIVYVLIGIVAGVVGWNGMEDKYQNALREARVKASPSGELPPHNSPLRITADSQSE